MEVAIVFMLSCFAAAFGSECDLTAPLPKSVPISYVGKIGTWYQTVSSNDYISAQYICGTLSRVEVNYGSETFNVSGTKYYRKAKPRPYKIYARRSIEGYYEAVKIDDRLVSAHLFDQYGKLNVKALEEDYRIAINPGKRSLIGDGARYFAFVKCTLESWAVWIYTPQKVLTTDELLYIRNELVKNGIHTELRLGKCEDINPEECQQDIHRQARGTCHGA